MNLRSTHRKDIMIAPDRLTSLLLKHWTEADPSKVSQLRQQHRLQEELKAKAEAFTDRMYELVSVNKMDYMEAWEMAVDQFLIPEADPSSTISHLSSATETFASRKPTLSGWAGRMRRSKDT